MDCMKQAINRLGVILISLILLALVLTVAPANSVHSFSVSIRSVGQITSGQDIGNVEADFLVLVNAERSSLGKNSLTAKSALRNAAYFHSKDMGDNNYFSHTSLDGRTFDQRIAATVYQTTIPSERTLLTLTARQAKLRSLRCGRSPLDIMPI
jgi:hypothetical protein